MLNKKSDIGCFIKRINFFLIGVVSLVFSLNCYSDSKSMNGMSAKNKPRYECGKRCASISRVEFRLIANRDFHSKETVIAEKMNKFKDKFSAEINKLNPAHKIDFESTFSVGSFDSRYFSKKSALRVYIDLSKDKCSASGVNFEVVSLAENEISFDKLKCEESDGACFDDVLLKIFQERIVRNVADPVVQHVQY